MTDIDKVVQLHATPEVGSEERARRLGVEVERLARLPPFEWLLYLDETARRYEVPPTKLKQMIEATVRANERKAREAKADDRREKRQVEQKQERDDRLSVRSKSAPAKRLNVPVRRLSALNVSWRPSGKSARRNLSGSQSCRVFRMT